MTEVTVLKNIEDFVTGITAKSGTIFPVDIRMSPSNDIKVFIDADDGITIEKCSLINKALYKYIEETELFPGGNFSLEVSSPGLEEPLKSIRQYKKNIGRNVEVVTLDGAKTEGKLLNVNDHEITIEERIGKGKKAIVNTKNILFNEIKHTIVLIIF